jgi:dipeptidyl aminopeptidase/acylaminoacyl peptidase
MSPKSETLERTDLRTERAMSAPERRAGALAIGPEFAFHDRPVFSPSLSPDGRYCAYVIGACEANRERMRTDVVVMDFARGTAKTLPGVGRDLSPKMSPNGTKLTLLRPDEKGVLQLWICDLKTSRPRKVTSTLCGVGDYCWSPGGDALAFSSDVVAWGRGESAATDGDTAVRVVRELAHRVDTVGWRNDRVRQIFVIRIDGRGVRQLTTETTDCRSPAWSPDGRKIAFIKGRLDAYSAPAGAPVSSAQVIGLNGGRVAVWSIGLSSVCTLTWSPDSKCLIALGSEDTSVPAQVAGFLYLLCGGLAPVRLTDDSVRPAGGWPPVLAPPPVFCPVPDRVLFIGDRQGRSYLLELAVARRAMRALRGGRGMLADVTIDRSGRRAVLLEIPPHSPGMLVLHDRRGGRARPLATNGGPYLARRQPATMHKFTTAVKGGKIESRLFFPPRFTASRKYPLIVDLHGGPHAAFYDSFLPLQQILATHGFIVLAVNPRGSSGYGRSFLKAIHGRWGQIDCADVLAALKKVSRRGYVDASRVGVMGVSYGGFLAASLLTEVPGLRAAALISPVVNLVSMYGTSDIGVPYCETQLGGGLPRALKRYLQASPLFRAEQVNVPVLLLHGEEDRRCPIEQSEQYFTALRGRGKTAELIRFPGCTHTLGFMSDVEPRSRHRLFACILHWFERHVMPMAPLRGRGLTRGRGRD